MAGAGQRKLFEGHAKYSVHSCLRYYICIFGCPAHLHDVQVVLCIPLKRILMFCGVPLTCCMAHFLHMCLMQHPMLE